MPEEQAASLLTELLNQIAVYLIPLAVAGLMAWISPFINDERWGWVAKLINRVGGNVLAAGNDATKQK